MKLDLTDMLFSLSEALDIVEHEMTGVQSAHGKHVAYLTALMGKGAGFKGEELSDFVCTAMLHDHAFTEYVREEYTSGDVVDVSELKKRADMLSTDDYLCFISGSKHSVAGEKNIQLIPFSTDIKNIILYHHENSDGTGVFKTTDKDTSLKSQIVHLADTVDVIWNILTLTEEEYAQMREKIAALSGIMFSPKSVELFLSHVSFEKLSKLKAGDPEALLKEEIETIEKNYTDSQIHDIALFFAKIVDCKSSFTRYHCVGAAEKADLLAKYYAFPEDKAIRFYLSAALHDIGKLVIQNDILEKRGKLNEKEFTNIKTHAEATKHILSKIKNFEDITAWASNHHEKLDGSGYPKGLKAEALTFEDRLMACIDIYQALTEPRPYKAPISHKKAIEMMRDMAKNNKIDEGIVNDMETVFA